MLNHFLRTLTDWVFRRRSAGLTLVRMGVLLLTVASVSLTVGLTIPTKNGPFVFSWDTSDGPAVISYGIFAVAVAMIIGGALLVFRDVRSENRDKIIVIEARGLRDWQGDPLEKAVPISLRGRRDALIVDVRQGLVDGQIVSPERALQKLAGVSDDIARSTDGLNRADVSFALGGLAPVPLLFLLGVMVDDEHRTLFMDWDRKAHVWRPLDEDDDGRRFDVTGLGAVGAGTARVALCVSASYDVLDADVRLVEPTAPIVRLDLQGRSTASHWSEDKQQQLSQQFLDTVMALSRQGVNEIALFLAAPASLSLRLGSVYDKRNLPSVTVNQFEQADPVKFPWAVRMPVAGLAQPQLVHR